MPTLAAHRYGKRGIRLVKVTRHPGRHDLKEVTVNIYFDGDFESCFRTGDNSLILPTDTMKNTVYALARNSSLDSIEHFGVELVKHFLANNRQARQVRVKLVETAWSPIAVEDEPHRSAFQRQGPEKRTAEVTDNREHQSVTSGIEHLVLLKTSDSAFEGFIRDRFTTLREASDRLLGTEIRALWRYAEGTLAFNELWNRASATLKTAFAQHQSRSVQHTLFAMGKAVLSAVPEIEQIYLVMPNKHCLLVDLTPFGLDNPNEVFVPVDEPSGFIEARVTR